MYKIPVKIIEEILAECTYGHEVKPFWKATKVKGKKENTDQLELIKINFRNNERYHNKIEK